MLEKRKKFSEQFKQFLLDSYKHKYKTFIAMASICIVLVSLFLAYKIKIEGGF